MRADDLNDTVDRPSRAGILLVAAAILCLVASGGLMWWHHGAGVFASLVTSALGWCF